MAESIISSNNTHYTQQNPEPQHSWYSPKTGIYTSKHPKIQLPNDPFLDLVSHISSYPNNGDNALIDSSSGYSIPYSHLFPLVKSTAFALKQMGISQGDLVLILLPNSIYFPILFLGVVYLGAIVTPMNPLSTFSEVKHQTLGVHVSLAFTLVENAIKLRTLGINVIEVPDSVDFGGESGSFSDFYRLIYGNVGAFVPKPRINQDDTAAILYSSGTTGASKGVVLTHRNFIAMVELFVQFKASQYKEMSWTNVYLDVLPMFHIYGVALFVFGLVSLGTGVVMRKFDINEVVKAIERFKVTHFPVVPSMLVALTNKAKSLGTTPGLESLKQVSVGAAAIRTESTAVGCRGFNVGDVHKYASVGLLALNMEAEVVSLNTNSCLLPGKAGELLL